MLKFSRRKTSSKSDENACSSNGCVGGRNGEQMWPMGADGPLVHSPYEDCVSDLETRTSTYAAPCHDAQTKTRRASALSVLHVIRDKLKPSTSKSRSLQSADCISHTGHCRTEAAQDSCNLTTCVSGEEYDVINECSDHTDCTGQCSYCLSDIALLPAEKYRSGVGESSTTEEPVARNSVDDQLMIVNAVERNAPKLDFGTDFQCSAVKPLAAHGGLVLSQLSNIVSVESCIKSDKVVLEGASRLPLSPLSNSDGGLDIPDDCQPVKWTLANELLRLSRYGWYWGPVSREEAEEKLAGQPEGAFLVRDSTDDRYLFSLSFRSSGRTLHTRVEYCNGEFSFYAQPRSDSYRSMAELIEQCVAESQSGIYCYSRGTGGGGAQSYPVKLTRPVSRFAQVRTLQYLCRFVIRQHTRVDHIQSLPLPVSVKGWLKENQY